RAADGIGCRHVTGVQACALPIWLRRAVVRPGPDRAGHRIDPHLPSPACSFRQSQAFSTPMTSPAADPASTARRNRNRGMLILIEIGRASWRERGITALGA